MAGLVVELTDEEVQLLLFCLEHTEQWAREYRPRRRGEGGLIGADEPLPPNDPPPAWGQPDAMARLAERLVEAWLDGPDSPEG